MTTVNQNTPKILTKSPREETAVTQSGTSQATAEIANIQAPPSNISAADGVGFPRVELVPPTGHERISLIRAAVTAAMMGFVGATLGGAFPSTAEARPG